ncbi:MAG: VC0807 family protein, partial [Bdellovibrionota bacterium]|nr:VC0807 family protein [Bdellovibrionota bacterium]
KTKKLNPISVLGFVNVLATGGLALFKLEGIWFAVKEGLFPLIIGIAVYLSSQWKNPLIKALLFNDQIFDVDKIQKQLDERSTQKDFDQHLRKSTKFFAYTFFLSAILNFVLAMYIFKDIPLELPDLERSTILNEQIADMTWKSYFVIVIPSMLCMFILLNYLIKGVNRYTGLGFQDVINQPETK